MGRRGDEDRTGVGRGGGAEDPARRAASWANWQSALYVLVLACVFLVPLTSLWWIVPVLGAAVPIALALLAGSGPRPPHADEKGEKERELLGALSERGDLTPAAAAMRTSLTVDEASKMLKELARRAT